MYIPHHHIIYPNVQTFASHLLAFDPYFDFKPCTTSIYSHIKFTNSGEDKGLVDAVSRRLARRGGRVPSWYPSSWRRNARKATRFYSASPVMMETDLECE